MKIGTYNVNGISSLFPRRCHKGDDRRLQIAVALRAAELTNDGTG